MFFSSDSSAAICSTIERLTHVVVQIIRSVLRMMSERVPESSVGKICQNFRVVSGGLADGELIHQA